MGSGTNEWTDLVSENITFTGPVDQVRGKQKFIELNQGFFPSVRGYEHLNAFEQGNFVCLEGTFKVATPRGNEIELQMAEVYTIGNGKIEEVRVYYDAEEFRKEFGK
jgi:ketosteroid isomerase-like protein